MFCIGTVDIFSRAAICSLSEWVQCIMVAPAVESLIASLSSVCSLFLRPREAWLIAFVAREYVAAHDTASDILLDHNLRAIFCPCVN